MHFMHSKIFHCFIKCIYYVFFEVVYFFVREIK